MGIKISSLPVNALPYTGAEKVPIVQSGETRGGTLSSFVNYLSGSSLLDNVAFTNADNNFSTTQTIVGSSVADEFKPTGGSGSTTISLKRLDGGSSFGITDTLTGDVLGTNVIALGEGAMLNGGIGTSSTLADTIAIGYGAGNSIGQDGGTVNDVIAIGYNSGYQSGLGFGVASDCIFLGDGAGYTAGSNIGSVTDLIAIGTSTAGSAGAAGTITNTIAIGKYAGSSVSVGNGGGSPSTSEVIMIGTNAGYGIAHGSEDTVGGASNVIAIGNNAGYDAGSTGTNIQANVSDLIAIGRSAGYRVGYETIAANNIYIGLSSGYNKQGSRNTFVGDLTNTSPTSSINLSGCIAIGYGATPTARNTIAIGSASTPLSVVPGRSTYQQLSALKIMINGTYYTIPLFS